MVSIYCLTDNGTPFYVGKTKYLAGRLSRHLRSSKLLANKKDIRIQDILSSGRKLEIKSLCECEEIEALDFEANYIKEHLLNGVELVNVYHNTYENLSILERQFLILMSKDIDTRDCAKILFRSERTLETVRQKLKEKAGVKTIAGLLVWSIEQGYVVLNL